MGGEAPRSGEMTRMLEQLQRALSAAYNLETLQRMVRFKLAKDLYDYAAPGNKQQVIFELLQAAEQEGFVEKLVAAARDFNPGNETLREFAFQYGVESTKKSGPELQRLIDATTSNLDPVQLRQQIFEAETRICRITILTNEGRLNGTGFLVHPDIIMTNYHVMEPVIAGRVAADRVDVRFDYKRTPEKVVSEGTSCSLAAHWQVAVSKTGDVDEPEDNELDYAIVQISEAPRDPSDAPRGYYRLVDRPIPPQNAALFIMQHPSGGAAELAMDTRAVLGLNTKENRIRYRTNTESGSSGSPCFTPSFELIAMHQAGDPDYSRPAAYNQGVPIRSIVSSLKNSGGAARLDLD